jgi:hypothetical protein
MSDNRIARFGTLINRAASVTSPAGVQSGTRGGDITYLNVSSINFSKELFTALDVACRVQAGLIADQIMEVVLNQSHSAFGGVKYPNSTRRYPKTFPDGGLRESGKYLRSWELKTLSGMVKHAKKMSPEQMGKSRHFVVRNTKVRYGGDGQVYPVAKYLEFGGARKPAKKGRYILTKAVNYVLSANKYGIKFPTGYLARALKVPGVAGYTEPKV